MVAFVAWRVTLLRCRAFPAGAIPPAVNRNLLTHATVTPTPSTIIDTRIYAFRMKRSAGEDHHESRTTMTHRMKLLVLSAFLVAGMSTDARAKEPSPGTLLPDRQFADLGYRAVPAFRRCAVARRLRHEFAVRLCQSRQAMRQGIHSLADGPARQAIRRRLGSAPLWFDDWPRMSKPFPRG